LKNAKSNAWYDREEKRDSQGIRSGYGKTMFASSTYSNKVGKFDLQKARSHSLVERVKIIKSQCTFISIFPGFATFLLGASATLALLPETVVQTIFRRCT
jgi:hypothetical protein